MTHSERGVVETVAAGNHSASVSLEHRVGVLEPDPKQKGIDGGRPYASLRGRWSLSQRH